VSDIDSTEIPVYGQREAKTECKWPDG
jgi:hypothetical protein